MKTIYYAHSMAIYNKPQEQRDVAMLEAAGFKVMNPNAPEHELAYKAAGGLGMHYFEELVNRCDALAFRAHPDGSIGAGMMAEILRAQDSGKPVIELPSNLRRRYLTVDQTREYLREAGQR
jgi:hypothetical protein